MATRQYVSVYKSAQARDELLAYYDRIVRNWPVPYRETVVETRSGRTHILQCGKEDGRPLLLFHGTGNNCLMWRYNVERLGRQFRLHLIDTINDPGKSEAAADFSPETGYSLWVNEVLDALAIQKASLLGHSKGGWIALNSAVSVPARVDRIVLLAPAAGINAGVRPQFMLRSLAIGLFPSSRTVESYLRYMSGPKARINSDYAAYLARLIRGTKMRLVKHRQFTDEELRGIQAPVLLLFGDHDVSVDYRKVVARATSCIKKLDVHVVAGAGHALQGEEPELVDNLIIDFLQETRPAAAA